MLNIFKRNKKTDDIQKTNEPSEKKQQIKTFEEFEKEQKTKDNDQLKKCLDELSNFKTLDKTDKLIFISSDCEIIGKTNLNSIKTLFECSFITKTPYNETYLNRTYTGFTYESKRMRIYITDKGTVIFSDYYGTWFWKPDKISNTRSTINKITDIRNFNKDGECSDKTIIKVNLHTDNMSPDCRELYYYIKDI